MRPHVPPPSAQALVLYGPGFCDWGVKAKLKSQISATLGMAMPEYIHVVIGGIMLFTAAAVRAFTDSTLLMQCIDDLETLYGKHLELWGGLKESALYNQDWLFCWCLQAVHRAMRCACHALCVPCSSATLCTASPMHDGGEPAGACRCA